MKKYSPCYNCEERRESCHSDCADYLAYQAEVEEERDKRDSMEEIKKILDTSAIENKKEKEIKMRTKTVVLDGETQEPIDELAERNEEIKERLAPTLAKFLEKEAQLMAMKKPPKLGYQFAKQIFLVLSSYGQMSVEEYASLDYETLNDYWLKYLELTAYYNEFFEIVDNKQMFCAFARLNTRQYAQLERSDDEDIANLMNTINSAFVGLGWLAGESGNADSKAVKNRLGASNEDGHSVISAIEEKVFGDDGMQTEGQVAKELEALGIKYLPK